MSKLSKGLISRIRNGNVVGDLHFQFNPTTIKRSGTVEWMWGQGPGALLPVATFGKMGEMTIDLELLYNAREGFKDHLEGLRGVLSEAESLGLPAVDRWSGTRDALAVAPDRCQLVIGTRRWHCNITTWGIVEEMWNRQLAPTQARVTYTLRLAHTGAAQVQQYVNQIRNFRERYEGTIPPPAPKSPAAGPFDGGL